MAGINLTVHLEYEEIVERLKAEGWIIPVRCEDCMWWDERLWGCKKPGHGFASSTPDFYCADGKRKGGNK
jgi:hypothetical protein